VNQPILVLAGRPIVRGPSAWLWSHGYELREREADVRRIFAGMDDALELLRYYKVDYVYLGEVERQDLRGNVEFFDGHFPVVYRNANVSIYDTQDRIGTGLDAQRSLSSPPPRELASRLGKDPYFLLVEFERVAYPVCRFYRVAFGRPPKYEELMAAMKVFGHGLFVDAPGWQEVLASNQKAFLEDWFRNDVQAFYETKSNEQYVAALLANAGRAKDHERAELISSLNRGSQTRAGILRHLADKQAAKADFNSAYVLLHYFAYLGRNPDDAPDQNLAGFNFWLTDLNNTGDYRTLSRVFLESDEYKNRPLLK
jgi:hypothetical protein